MNGTKETQLTNIGSCSGDKLVRLILPRPLTLEVALLSVRLRTSSLPPSDASRSRRARRVGLTPV